MNTHQREVCVSRLNGYLQAMADVDGQPWSALADAYLLALDEGDLQVSLRTSLGAQFDDVLGILNIDRVTQAASTVLDHAMRHFFFRHPFSAPAGQHLAQVARTREHMISRAMTLIEAITDNFACDYIYRVEVERGAGHEHMSGTLYIVPLTQGHLVMGMLRKKSAATRARVAGDMS